MRTYMRRVCLWFVVMLVLSTFAASITQAYDLQAIVGEPFGVGKMTVSLDAGATLAPDSPMRLVDRQGRVLYPAFEGAGVEDPGSKDFVEHDWLTVYFLFRGDGPLKLDLQTDRSHRATVQPVVGQDAHAKLLAQWWSCYTAAAKRVTWLHSYLPLVERYLTVTLARRLGLEPPKRPPVWYFGGALDQLFAFATGTESVRLSAQSDVLLEHGPAAEEADRLLPEPAELPPLELPPVAADVAVEPIALHVPAECFYIRCGSFAHFVWLRRAIDQWGANVRNLASVRGLNYRIMQRIQRQLALQENALANLLGGAVISDVVVLGTDVFLHEGAAIGVLFEARDTDFLKHQIAAQRQEALGREKDAKEEIVRIAGREVSLLSTRGNQVRSFHAVDGKYHLVTTSRTLVRRFFEAGQGWQSLGKSEEFRWARSVQPVAANHTAFVYLSDPFFRQLIGPRYRVEMIRRVRAAAEIDVIRLARLAARAEGNPAATVEQLVDGDVLPRGFGRRPDGSRLVLADGEVTDSLRGAYGSFLPVCDVEIGRATPSEVESYEEFSKKLSSVWRKMGPVIVGITRRDIDGPSTQRVTFDVHVRPYGHNPYAELMFLSLDAADKQRFASVPGDFVSGQINLFGEKFAVGLRDSAPEYTMENGRVHYPNLRKTGGINTTIPCYVASQTGALKRFFPKSINVEQPDEDGDIKVRFPVDGWLRRLGDFDLAASDKQTLAEVGSHVKLIEAERPATLRARIADWRQCKLAAVSRAHAYVRCRKSSAGNVALMHALTQQLHVPAAQAKEMAEELLGAALVCPLGGRYELTGEGTPFDQWGSTAWQHASRYRETEVPADFQAAGLNWFAGLLLEMDIDKTALSTHVELDVRATQP